MYNSILKYYNFIIIYLCLLPDLFSVHSVRAQRVPVWDAGSLPQRGVQYRGLAVRGDVPPRQEEVRGPRQHLRARPGHQARQAHAGPLLLRHGQPGHLRGRQDFEGTVEIIQNRLNASGLTGGYIRSQLAKVWL